MIYIMKTKYLIATMIAVLIFSVAIVISAEQKKKPTSAREICHRKCQEEMDKCVEEKGINRIKCAKQYDECIDSCNALLNE